MLCAGSAVAYDLLGKVLPLLLSVKPVKRKEPQEVAGTYSAGRAAELALHPK